MQVASVMDIRYMSPYSSSGVDAGEDEDEGGAAGLVARFSANKKAFQARKDEHYKPAPRFGGYEEEVTTGAKRAATYEMMKNKGLTPHRKKANRNPRVKKRQMYHKAVIARKGQVRDVVTAPAAGYGGELTGIKANLSRARKIGT